METITALRERIRSPVVNGLFYPDDRAGLLAKIKSFGLERGAGGTARAIIAPHGAWDISGTLAGSAFAAACGQRDGKNPSVVVLLGPLHDPEEKGIFLSNSHSFETPLGNIPVNMEITETLEACSPIIKICDIPHLQEHCLEVLLPFVQYCFPHAAIVPILMGRQPGAAAVSALASALKTAFEPVLEQTLFVVSSCLSMAADKITARLLAVEAMRLLVEKKADDLVSAVYEGKLNAFCGGALVAGLLKSGLLDKARPCHVPLNMISAKRDDGNTIFYGAVSFE